MPLFENDNWVEDRWQLLADDEPLPAHGAVIISLARLAEIENFAGELGVEITNTVRVEEIAPYFAKIKLIRLPFPAFTDGRAYSLARQLREYGFTGILRASGNILPDQLQMMRQVGFNSFEIAERFTTETLNQASGHIRAAYQTNYLEPQAARLAIWKARSEKRLG